MPRLLWRGSLSLQQTGKTGLASSQLHGLAIVAREFQLPTLHDGNQGAEHDIDDPFKSSPVKTASSADAELCLDLEMLRNRSLNIANPKVRLKERGTSGDANSAPAKLHGRKALKKSIEMLRKGKEKSLDVDESGRELQVVHLDRDTDNDNQEDNLTIHIDQRCTSTIRYFNEIFCRELVDPVTRRTRIGMILSLGEDEEDINPFGVPSKQSQHLVVYGKLAPHENHSSSKILQLFVVRPRKRRELGPRPDDPAPRENLFAQKLRRTVSQPVLTNPNGGHLNGASKDPPRLLHRSQSSSIPPSKARNLFGEASSGSSSSLPSLVESNAAGKKRTLSTTQLGSGKNKNASPGRRGLKRQRLSAVSTAVDSNRLQPKPRSKADLLTARTLQNLQEEEPDSLELLEPATLEEDDPFDRMTEILNREGSPTPSVATNPGLLDQSGKLTSKIQTGQKRDLSRSLSMPPGQVSLKKPPERAASVAASEGGEVPQGGDSAVSTRNKGTLRKILLAEMSNLQHGREHPEFKDIFGIVYKGVQYSFRRTINDARLDKELLTENVRKHLKLYIT